MIKISIRVPDWSSFDANAFAVIYGGGGHVKAAGCHMTLGALLALIYKNKKQIKI